MEITFFPVENELPLVKVILTIRPHHHQHNSLLKVLSVMRRRIMKVCIKNPIIFHFKHYCFIVDCGEMDDEMPNKNDDNEVNEETSTISDAASSNAGPTSVARKRSVPIMKRARPVSKRKVFSFVYKNIYEYISFFWYKQKFKKSLGPDFVESSELGLQYLRDTFEPKCDYCEMTATSNKRGEREELLVCKDCSAKGLLYTHLCLVFI